MSWSDIYLFCFLVGLALSVLSFLAGAVHLHLPFNWHLPFHIHSGHGGGHGVGHVSHGGSGGAAGKSSVHLSWFNASSVLAFLAWFGGMGYILSTHSNFMAIAILGLAIAAGGFAAWMVYRFMFKLLQSEGAQMNEWDYRHEGSVGKISIGIPANGTGEVIFEQHGIRRSVGARGEDGESIEKGSEVVISRYEKGLAYVKKWDEFTNGKV
jgi:membrane protein implicated in regulation of membrane protease activity